MLELNKNDLVKILHKNFRFKKTRDPDYGDAIKMDARSAFRYSMIEGSPYLVNEYGFSCKGRMNVFYHRSSLNKNFYTYCPGLFGVKRIAQEILLDQGNSPLYIKEKYPRIFRGEKTIIFLEHDATDTQSRAELEKKVYKKLKERNDDPSKFILTVVYDRDSNKESFFEYIACEYFNSKNYLTEAQVPFKNNSGIPDFAAYSFPKINKLIEKKFISGGCCINEIATASVFKNNSDPIDSIDSYKILIGEVKVSADNALKQIKKYSSEEIADHIFEIIPKKDTPETDFGLFSIDESTYKIKFVKDSAKSVNLTIHDADEIFLENYVKFYVLANLSIEKIKEKFIDKNKLESESSQLIRNVLDFDFDDLLDYVQGEI